MKINFEAVNDRTIHIQKKKLPKVHQHKYNKCYLSAILLSGTEIFLPISRKISAKEMSFYSQSLKMFECWSSRKALFFITIFAIHSPFILGGKE